METIKIEVAQGYVDQRELGFREHSRATNWIATVVFDPSQLGSLGREFWVKGSGSFKAIPSSLKIGEFVEVAHDYTTGGGNRDRCREYYRVVSVNSDELVLAADESPKKKSISIADFAAQVAGEERVQPSIDLSGVSDDELISELEHRGHKLNFAI